MSETTTNELDRLTECGNCGETRPQRELGTPRDLWMRLDAGSEVPAGECPSCGALAYLANTPVIEDTEWLYEVKIGVIIGVTLPPGHPDIRRALMENAADRISREGPGDTGLIDSYSLIQAKLL